MSGLDPKLWADHIADQFRFSTFLGDLEKQILQPTDMWNGEDPGLFDEAVAWASLLGITVLKPNNSPTVNAFRLLKPGYPPVMLPACSPTKLIETLRAFADGTLDRSKTSTTLGDSIRFGNHRS